MSQHPARKAEQSCCCAGGETSTQRCSSEEGRWQEWGSPPPSASQPGAAAALAPCHLWQVRPYPILYIPPQSSKVPDLLLLKESFPLSCPTGQPQGHQWPPQHLEQHKELDIISGKTGKQIGTAGRLLCDNCPLEDSSAALPACCSHSRLSNHFNRVKPYLLPSPSLLTWPQAHSRHPSLSANRSLNGSSATAQISPR